MPSHMDSKLSPLSRTFSLGFFALEKLLARHVTPECGQLGERCECLCWFCSAHFSTLSGSRSFSPSFLSFPLLSFCLKPFLIMNFVWLPLPVPF